jgi:hypothetical protein
MIHDAIQYMTDTDMLRDALGTAASHCSPGGLVAVMPDFVRETFEAGTDHGGEDGADGHALRYLEWSYDPDPDDSTYIVDYAFLLRSPDGSVETVHDRHVEGLFSREEWLARFAAAGIPAMSEPDPWGRDVFVGVKPG